jgi:hypothetical protein
MSRKKSIEIVEMCRPSHGKDACRYFTSRPGVVVRML